MNSNKYEVIKIAYISLWDVLDEKSFYEAIKALEAEYIKHVTDFCLGKCLSKDVIATIALWDNGIDLCMSRPMTTEERAEVDRVEQKKVESQESKDRALFDTLKEKYGW